MSVPPNWMIKTRQLELLERLGRLRHLGRAAESIQMQQPAASRMVAALERTLETSLFTRTAKGMDPTPTGDYLISRAGEILGSIKDLSREIDDFSEGRKGIIRIGIVPSILSDLLVQAVQDLFGAAAGTRLAMLQANHAHLVEELAHGDLDVVISRAPAPVAAPGLTSRLLFMEEYLLVASHTAEAGDVADLLDLSWILPPEGLPLRRDIDLYLLSRFGRRPDRIVEATAIELVGNLLAAIPSVAPMPRNYLELRGKVLPVSRVDAPGARWRVPVFLLTGATAPFRPSIVKFLEIFENAAVPREDAMP